MMYVMYAISTGRFTRKTLQFKTLANILVELTTTKNSTQPQWLSLSPWYGFTNIWGNFPAGNFEDLHLFPACFFHLPKELREFCGKQFQPCDSRRAPQVGTGLLVVVGDITEPTPPPKGSQIVRESSKIETQAEAFQANFWQVCIKS